LPIIRWVAGREPIPDGSAIPALGLVRSAREGMEAKMAKQFIGSFVRKINTKGTIVLEKFDDKRHAAVPTEAIYSAADAETLHESSKKMAKEKGATYAPFIPEALAKVPESRLVPVVLSSRFGTPYMALLEKREMTEPTARAKPSYF